MSSAFLWFIVVFAVILVGILVFSFKNISADTTNYCCDHGKKVSLSLAKKASLYGTGVGGAGHACFVFDCCIILGEFPHKFSPTKIWRGRTISSFLSQSTNHKTRPKMMKQVNPAKFWFVKKSGEKLPQFAIVVPIMVFLIVHSSSIKILK